MDTFKLVMEAAWKVLWVGLVLGAGLPVLFAAGVKLVSGRDDVSADGSVTARPASGPMKALGWLCFAIVLYCVAAGIMVIVAAGLGKIVEFHGILPVLAPKPH